MPSWGNHSDGDLWDTIAFMGKLPAMTEQEYAVLVMASIAAGGHHMHGVGHMSVSDMESGRDSMSKVPGNYRITSISADRWLGLTG